jgi:membrane-associated phospholipid phosphatase
VTQPLLGPSPARSPEPSPARSAARWAWLAVAAIVAFAVLGFVVHGQGAVLFDEPVIAFVKGLPISTETWTRVTAAGGAILIPIDVLIVVALLARRRWRLAAIYGLALAGASIWTSLVKITIARVRPAGSLVVAPGFSFPSGHSLNSTVTYGLIALLVWRTGWPTWLRLAAAIVLAGLPVLIGLSRIALGAHYPTDVLGGWLGGIAIVATVATFTQPDPDVALEVAPDEPPAGRA